MGVFLYLMSKATKGCRRRRRCPCLSDDRSNAWLFGNIELLTLSLFFSAIVSVFLLAFRKVGKKKRIPFVPFTAIAYGVVMVL